MAEVRRIEPADAGRPLSVAYYDEAEKAERHVRARKVVLAAGTLESARILLASASPRFPDGLGNASGVLGRYLMDHIMVDTDAVVHGGPPPDSVRAYRTFFAPTRRYPSLYGAAQFQAASSNQTTRGDGDWRVGLKAFGQTLPSRANHIRLTGRKTANGAPIAEVSFKWSPEDLTLGEAIKDDARALLACLDHSLVSQATAIGGDAIHQVGTCRMGRDPRTSAVDGDGRMHDVPDVYVVDGSTWPTLPEKNPTLTMMAIAMRAGDRLGAALARGES
jgi:choline dehydrogenase-like flavoprotein